MCGFASAQNEQCSMQTVLASFEAASLSDDVQTWVNRYENSTCPENVVQGVRQLARGYETLSSQSIAVSQGISSTWRGYLVPNWSYPGVSDGDLWSFSQTQEFDFALDGSFEGVTSWESGDYTGAYEISGRSYSNPDQVQNIRLWQVIDGYDEAATEYWLRWIGIRDIRGESLLQVLYVAVITDDGLMKGVSYDEINGGNILFSTIYWSTAS